MPPLLPFDVFPIILSYLSISDILRLRLVWTGSFIPNNWIADDKVRSANIISTLLRTMPSGWLSSKTTLYAGIFRFQASTEDLSRMSRPMTWNASPWRQRSTGLTGLQGHLDPLAMVNFPLCLISMSHLSISALGEANIGYSPCPLYEVVVLILMSSSVGT